MKRFAWSLTTGLVVAATVVASGSAADEPATSPAGTTPVPSTPQCEVDGPQFNDRSEPLRTALPSRHTLISVSEADREKLPDRLPRSITKQLAKDGALLVPADEKGWTGIKSMWRRDRRAAGRLQVTGKRLDDGPGEFKAVIDRQYGGKKYSSFVPGTLNFSTTGCWRVTGRAGKIRVTYTVLVRAPEPGEFAPYLP